MNSMTNRLRHLYIIQLCNLISLTIIYSIALYRIQNTHCDGVVQERRIRRDLSSLMNGNYQLTIPHDNKIMPKGILDKICHMIHRHCFNNEMKMLGFHGLRGLRGPKGSIGITGERGEQGKIGPSGLRGKIGDIGPPGFDGECDCSLEDVHAFQTNTDFFPDLLTNISMNGVGRNYTYIGDIPMIANHTTPSYEANDTLIEKFDTAEEQTEFLQALYGTPLTIGVNKRECMLNAIGIPVLHAESQYSSVGSWMRDSRPVQKVETRWLTDEYASPVLYEYEDERQLMNKKQKIKYYVDYLASGTGSIVYNGSYYYHRHGSTILVRYNLQSSDQIQSEFGDISHCDCVRKPDHTFEDCNEEGRDIWLYNRPHNYIDFAVDENGLWVVYVRLGSLYITVSKIEPDFQIVKTFDIEELNAKEIADTFIMCGVLYGVKSATDRNTLITFAYDLFKMQRVDVNVSWYNPYQGMTMLDYNPIDNRLYFFDAKKLLSVNVRVNGSTERNDLNYDAPLLD